MDPISSILATITAVVSRVWPDKTKEGEVRARMFSEQLNAQLQLELAKNELLTKQIDVNAAEAANPNRKWISWRELVGYVCALSVAYTYLLQPFLVFGFAAAGHPIKDLPILDMGQLMFLLCGMLGLSIGKTVEKIKGVR